MNGKKWTQGLGALETGEERLAKCMRLPAAGTRDPHFGLTRSFLNSLILPNRGNGFCPPVKSYVIRRPGAKTGVRLVDLKSLFEFIVKHAADGSAQHSQSRPTANQQSIVEG